MEISLSTKLNALSELSRLKLSKILKSIHGSKDMIIEQNLIRPLDKICGTKWLKLNNVEKIFKLEDDVSQKSNTQVYFISSNLLQLKRVLNQVQSNINLKTTDKVYHIIVVPKILNSFTVLLEELGLYGRVALHSFMWQFICIDQGILTLELQSFFTEIFVHKDLSLLSSIGKSLYFLFHVTGTPNIMLSIGKHSHQICNHIELFSKSLGESSKINSEFDMVILMDRSVDYVSALLTNVTYTGLLSEVYNINGNIVENRCLKSETPNAETKKMLFSLDSKNDMVYSEIKNFHISVVSDILGNQARQFKVESQLSQDMALSEMKTYVQTITAKSKYFGFHLQACEKIITEFGIKFENLQTTERCLIENVNKSSNLITIEDLIYTDNELLSLRLMCLISLTQKLTPDEYNNFKMKYLQTHGYNLLHLFQNLNNSGLIIQPSPTKLSALSLSSITQKKDFYSIANKLKLIPANPEEVNIRDPACPSYVFGGCYIPLIVQLLSYLLQARVESDIKSKIDLVGGVFKTRGNEKSFPLQQRTILVFIVGGLTYAEVAACNLIEKTLSCKIVLASDRMISGNDLVNHCM